MAATIKCNSVLAKFVGQTVGFVRVNKSWVNHNNSYECAAWWEDSKIIVGVYPLVLKKNYLAPHNLYLEADLQAEVVDDFFPALWGGVSVSNKPYVAKNLGQIRKVLHRVDIVEGIAKTGNSSSDMDYFVNPLLWDAFIEAAKESLADYHEYFAKVWAEYQADNSRISSVSYCTECMSELGKAIDEMTRYKGYVYQASDYMLNNMVANSNWVKAA